MAIEQALPVPQPTARRPWVSWLTILGLVSLIALVAIHPGLRDLASHTLRHMRSIPPGSLALLFLFKAGQSLCSALTWYNALRAAWPTSSPAYRFVLGVEQGQVAVNTVAPMRAGTWAMLGVFDMAIPHARPPKLLTVWGVQNLAFVAIAAMVSLFIAIGLPGRTQAGSGAFDRGRELAAHHPLPALLVAIVVVAAVIVLANRIRGRIGDVRQQVTEGLAILRTPGRYLRLMVLPSLASWLFSCAAYVVLLRAFHIPVTIWTLALALGSNALGGAIRITPGGLGPSQALDVIALRDYAPAEVVTAYSLSEIAISAIVSTSLALGAMLSISGWRGTRHVFRHLRR